MNHYRIYPIDVSGRIVGPPAEILCPNDAEALEQAREMLKDRAHAVEFWNGPRLVATWDAPQPAAVPSDPDRSVSQPRAQNLPLPEVATVAG